jgi:hypothetical protein
MACFVLLASGFGRARAPAAGRVSPNDDSSWLSLLFLHCLEEERIRGGACLPGDTNLEFEFELLSDDFLVNRPPREGKGEGEGEGEGEGCSARLLGNQSLVSFILSLTCVSFFRLAGRLLWRESRVESVEYCSVPVDLVAVASIPA